MEPNWKSPIVPAAFLVVGHFRHDSYAEKTALLAGEAYANSVIVDIVNEGVDTATASFGHRAKEAVLHDFRDKKQPRAGTARCLN